MRLEISVYLNQQALSDRKPVFCHSVDLDPAVTVPYERLVSVCKFLYGQNCVVVFISQ